MTRNRPISLDGLRVLFVDDSEDERDLFQVRLAGLGADLLTVRTAGEALDVLDCGYMEMLVTELRLPGVDGYSLARRMRALSAPRGGKMPAVAVTASNVSVTTPAVRAAGFAGVVRKPY